MRILVFALLLFPGVLLAGDRAVSFAADDGVTVFGDLLLSEHGKSGPFILLFHQGGGDARGEYANIAPRLGAAGYNVLSVDLRSGGDRFGSTNRTAEQLASQEVGYCDAYPDLVAALNYIQAEGFDGPLAVWGSSFSAALVFYLAAEFDDAIDAVLAFSPASGAPLAECSVADVIADVTAPVLALRPSREAAIESVKAQLAAFEDVGIQTWVSDPGLHGSSMLDAERVGSSTEATWTVVLDFLDAQLN